MFYKLQGRFPTALYLPQYFLILTSLHLIHISFFILMHFPSSQENLEPSVLCTGNAIMYSFPITYKFLLAFFPSTPLIGIKNTILFFCNKK